MPVLDLVARPIADFFSSFQNNAPRYVANYNPNRSMLGNAPGRPNVQAQILTMGSVPIVFAIVAGIGESMAEADWALYPIGGDEPVRNHPAALLWEQPNPHMDQDTFVKAAMEHYDLAGETDWYVSRTSLTRGDGSRISDMPLELWPVRPDFLTPIPHPTRYLDGWIYQVPGLEEAKWKNEDLVRMLLPSPFDPYRGIAPIAAAMRQAGSSTAAAEYMSSWYRNGAVPGGIIEFPERLPDEEFTEFTNRWREQHQGPSQANRVAILEGAKWTSITATMRDSQFEELAKLNEEWIRRVYRFPAALLGDSENVNKATVDGMQHHFELYLIRPRLSALQAVLNTKLLPMFGASAKGLEFRFESPVVDDKESAVTQMVGKANAAKTLIEAGFEPADVLRTVGLPDMGFEKPEPPALPAPSGDPATGARPQRRTTADDPEARAIWENAALMLSAPTKPTFEAVAGLVGVSERTLRRYRDTFAD